MCFFLQLLESPTAPYNPNVVLPTQEAQLQTCWLAILWAKEETSGRSLLPVICHESAPRSPDKGKALLQLVFAWEPGKGEHHTAPMTSWNLCPSFLLWDWNVAVLTLSPQPGVPLMFHQSSLQPWNPEYAIRLSSFNLLRGLNQETKKKWLLPYLRLTWVVFFYIISELSKQFKTQNLTWGFFLPQKMFTIDAEAFLYHITIVKK